MSNNWLPAERIAHLEGISDRAIRKAFKRSLEGHPWKGSQLIVRIVRGVGGKSGTSYQVLESSLPPHLQLTLKATSNSDLRPIKDSPEAGLNLDFWTINFGHILQCKPRSAARAAAVNAAASRAYLCPDGLRRTFSVRTINRNLKAIREGQISIVHGRKRRDAGKSRVAVSLQFDTMAADEGLTAEQLDAVSAELRTYIRSLTAKGTSRKLITQLASFKLHDLARRHGLAVSDGTFTLPARLIQGEGHYKRLARYDRDRKAHEDDKPRIMRSITGLRPVDIVMGDVHPVDILIRRPDGSTATARLISWMDCANRRMFVSVVLCEKGTGIRNSDVIQSFKDMVDAWGMPRALYLDNGSEYNWADLITCALKVANGEIQIERGDGPFIGKLGRVIRAKAWNAAAKGMIEGTFRILEGSYLSHHPGYIGGDRMMQKSANVGRPPVPFEGTIEELASRIQMAVQYYNALPQQGALKGQSPDQAFAKAVTDGWHMTRVAEDALCVAFSEEKVKAVRKGRIQHAASFWTCDELAAYHGDRVTVLVPKYERWNRLPLKDDKGRIFGFAEPDRAYDFLDPAGAEEAARRSTVRRKAVTALRRDVEDIDVQAELESNVVHLPRPVTAPVGATIGASDTARHIIAGITETPDDKAMREAREYSAKQDRAFARLQNSMKRRDGK